MKLSLTGSVQLEILERYFKEAGFEIAAPGEVPDVTYDVTRHDAVLSREIPGFYDERLRAIAGCPYSLDGIRAIVEEFRWERAAIESGAMSIPKKVLAVDADNTLWKGILSEDGRAALVPYADFQAGLRQLAADGVLLVLVSKNDPGSINWLDFFTLMKVNWQPKAGNLIEACRELNVGIDSVVFLDDNSFERAEMAAHLPEVAVAPWSGEPNAQTIRRLKEYFFSGKVTAEDRLRAADYRRRLTTREEYLGDLGLWVEARPAAPGDLERLVQMAGKTNQFNATTIRRGAADFGGEVFVFRCGDRFGEQGIVCYVIVDAATRRITDFVMSCRAMGRTLEYFVYDWITARFGARLPIDYVPTAKNAPFKAFLDRLTSGEPYTTFFQAKT